MTPHSHPGTAPSHTKWPSFWALVAGPNGATPSGQCHPVRVRPLSGLSPCWTSGITALLLGPAPSLPQLDTSVSQAPCWKPGCHNTACPRLWVRTHQGYQRAGRRSPPRHPALGDMVSPGPGAGLQRASRGGHHPGYAGCSRGFSPKSGLWPPYPLPGSDPASAPSQSLKDIQAWPEGIWGQGLD